MHSPELLVPEGHSVACGDVGTFVFEQFFEVCGFEYSYLSDPLAFCIRFEAADFEELWFTSFPKSLKAIE